MTRGLQLLLKRLIRVITLILFLVAGIVAVNLYFSPPQAALIELKTLDSQKAPDSGKSKASDPKLAKLLNAKMSKTVIAKVEAAPPKPPVPSLKTLVRVKGIMDFGDPKSNEAIVETIKGNQTKSYRVNERVHEVDAVITLIDTAVTFQYDGKTIRLNVNSSESAEVLPTAGSENSTISAEVKAPRQAP